jgi:hypothetical protein
MFFKYKKITFKLFLLFFRFNFIVYMVFINFKKFKYFIFNFELMKMIFNNKKHFKLNYHYFIYNNKYFKEIIITIIITEFYNIIKIILLEIYFFKHYAKK